MNAPKPSRAAGPAPLLFCCLLVSCLFQLSGCHPDQTSVREENYVTVKLHDSLSRYNSVLIQILAAGDTNQVVGHIWNGPLAAPGALPAYRMDDGESRDLSVRVRGYDATDRLVFDMMISKVGGMQVVTNVALPKLSPSLSSLKISPGVLTPAFSPAIKEYSLHLDYGQTSVRLILVPEFEDASLLIGFIKAKSGRQSDTLPMRVGPNRITISVTTADTSTQYIVTATRAAAPADTVVNPGPVPNPDPNPFVLNWKHWALVKLNPREVGLAMGVKIPDFPLLLRLNKNNFTFAQALSDGRDIRFVTSSGKLLPHEIMKWDAVNQEGRIWLRLDTLRADDDGDPILMYWGNPNAVSASEPEKVFPPESGWSGVWHLEETGKGVAGEYRDASGQAHATSCRINGSDPSRKDGTVGYAQDFKVANQQTAISIPDPFDPGAAEWSMHMWVKQSGGNDATLFSKADGTTANQQRFRINSLAGGRLALQRNGADYLTNIWFPDDYWMLVGIIYDGSNARVFIDGFERETMPWTQGAHHSAKAFLGAEDEQGTRGFSGTLDEIWFSSRAKSPEYMRMIFETQKVYSTFVTLLPL
ncbi:MAG: DUF2341 domain-containing protein [Fibrobacterota bacterium]|nr:DUF2341 domain-containing protein [Fibrobacterota bacterium]